ncbi:MAG: hypothetical protein IJ419_11330 [Agathobacter sp.]|nr:hypothetical protein [Agathobacter sp.]
MKRIVALLLILSMVLVLSGCGTIGMASAAGMPTEETEPEERTLMDEVGDLATQFVAEIIAHKIENWIAENIETNPPESPNTASAPLS